jgi:hypothetical protein
VTQLEEKEKELGRMPDSFDYHVFVCFAVSDDAIARPVWQELSRSGLRVFWSDATLKEKIGESWFNVIQSALERSQHFLLIASKASMDSPWVEREYQAFYTHCYKQGVRRLIPILTQDFQTKQLPLLLRGLEATKLNDPDCLKRIIHLLGGTPLVELKEEKDRLQLKERRLLRFTEIGGTMLIVTLVLLGFLFGSFVFLQALESSPRQAGPGQSEFFIAAVHVAVVLLFIGLQSTPIGGKTRNWDKYGPITEKTMTQFWWGWRWIWMTWLALYGWLSACWVQLTWYHKHEPLTWSVADAINVLNAWGFFFCFLALDEPSVPTADEPERADEFRRHIKLVVAAGIVVGVLSILGRSVLSVQLGVLGPLLASCYTGLAMAYLFGRFDSHHMNIPRFLLAPLYLYVIIQLTWVTFQSGMQNSRPSMFLGAALILKILLFLVVTYWLDHGVLLEYIKKAEGHFGQEKRPIENVAPQAG